jgi:hypothetical protein
VFKVLEFESPEESDVMSTLKEINKKLSIADTLGCECAYCVYVNSGDFLEGAFIRTPLLFAQSTC